VARAVKASPQKRVAMASMKTSARPPATRQQIIPLTGVRGAACVWVLTFHAYVLLRTYKLVGEWELLNRGYLGVDLFFVLSGFVLAMTYGSGLAAPRLDTLKNFYLGRALRILPLHWTVLCAFAAVAPLMSGLWWIGTPHSLIRWLASFFLVQNWIGLEGSWNGPAWSLSAEWMAYLAFPALAWATWKIRRGWHAALLGLGSLGLLTVITFVHQGKNFYGYPGTLGLLRCATEFQAGMLVYRLADIAPQVRRWGNGCMIAGFALLTLALSFKLMDGPAPFGFILIVLGCWSETSMAAVLFGNPVVAWLGKISFSLYLVHWLLIECTLGLLLGGPHGSQDPATAIEAIVLAMGSAVPVAALLYQCVERTSHRVARAVLYGERNSRAAKVGDVEDVPGSDW
jgi:peptidoglycan/LPS O-acetylase OafA/YrhL